MLILIIKFTLVFPIIWNYYALANESKIIIIIYDEILSDITKNPFTFIMLSNYYNESNY